MQSRSAKSYIEEYDRVSTFRPGETLAERDARVEAFKAEDRARVQADLDYYEESIRDLEATLAAVKVDIAKAKAKEAAKKSPESTQLARLPQSATPSSSYSPTYFDAAPARLNQQRPTPPREKHCCSLQ